MLFKNKMHLLSYRWLCAFLFLSSCGEVVSTRDYSTVITSQIGWKNVVDVNSNNISSFPLTGTCTTEAGEVFIQIGLPMMIGQMLQCNDGRFNGSIDLSTVPLAEGMIELRASQSVISADAMTNLFVDTIPPAAPVIITPAPSSIFNVRNQVVDGTCEDGAEVVISGAITGTQNTTPCTGGTFSRTVTLTSGDGPKIIVVRQTDSAGNISPNTNVTVTLDVSGSLLPAAPVITSPTPGTLTNTVAQTVVGTCEDGATLTISGSVAGSPLSASCVGGNFSEPINLTGVDGAKIITITQTNAAGTSPSSSVNLILDTTDPVAPIITSPLAGTNTNTLNQTITGNCETGATVSIGGNISGAPVASICVGGTYTEVVNLTPGDGPKSIDVTQTDPAGNVSPTTNVSINLDTLNPLAPTITSPLDSDIVTTVSQTIVGTCETGATVNISGGVVGSPVVLICAGGNYSQPVTLTPGDGNKPIVVSQTDPAGNGSPSTTITLTLDATAPAAPAITSPTNGTFVTTTAQTVVGTCEAGATVNISGAGIVGGPITVACPAGNYSQPVTLTAGDGAKPISATQMDGAGNTSVATNISITIDSTAPSAPLITAPVNGTETNQTAQTVVGTCEVGATVNISGAGVVGAPIAVACPAGNYSQPVTLTAGDGVKAITATQTDGAGNTSGATNISITLDGTAPVAPIISSPVDGGLTNQVAQTVVGTCEVDATVNISGAGIVGGPIAVACPAGNYSQPVNLTAGDGPKVISATQTDGAGNTSVASTVTVTLDATAPAAPVITSPINGTETNQVAQTVVGTCEIDATVNISGAGVVGGPIAVACPAGTYSQAVTLTAGDGAKAISATQTDAAGNTSVATNISITLDATAPAAPTITSPIDGTITNLVAQTVVGTCEVDATVNISGAGVVGGPIAVACPAGNYSQAINLVAGDGVKTISATQTDGAGNTSGATNISVTLDTGVPASPVITSPVPGSLTNQISQTLIGTCEVDATVNISGAGINGGPFAVACPAGSFTQVVNLTAGDGVKAIVATQTNLANSTSPPFNMTITLDATAPSAPTIITPVNGTTTNQIAQTVTGSCEIDATVNISGAGIVGGPIAALCPAGTYSQAVNLTAGDGAKAISATQTDVAGNTSGAINISVTLDATAPAVPTITSPSNNDITNQISQTIVGTCETDATVNIAGDISGSPVTIVCVGGNYSQPVTLNSGDGAKAISVTQTDGTGNTSGSVDISLVLDQTGPAAPTISSPINGSSTNSLAQTIIGTCETDATVNLTGNIQAAPVNFVCVGGNYSQAVNLIAGDGAKAISATQTDLAGNTSAATNISIILDATAPAAPTITSPVDLALLNSATQSLTGACENGANVAVTGNIVGVPIIFTCIGGTYNEPITLSAGDGVKAISVVQTDPVGNTSSPTNISVTLDTTLPLAPTITSPTDGSATNQVAQTIVGTCETDAEVQITGQIAGAPVLLTCAGGTYSQAVTLAGADGTKTITVAQTDPAGNLSPSTSITLDLVTGLPPAPTFTSPVDGIFTNSLAQNVIGGCVTGYNVTITGDFAGAPLNVVCMANAFSQAINLTAADGLKTISATQTDLALNVSPAASVSVTLDRTLPAMPSITSPADNAFVNAVAQNIIGTCETDAIVNVSGDFSGSPASFTCVAGTYNQPVNLTAGDGVKAISVQQTDLAGNASPINTISLNLDMTAPGAPLISAPVDGSYSNQIAQTVVGVCETDANVSLTGNIAGAPINFVCVGGNYSQAVNLTPGDAAKTITAIQTDSAGNASVPSTVIVNLDTTLPLAPTIATPTNGIITSDSNQTVSGICETDATVNISGDINASPISFVCVGGTYSQVVVLSGVDGVKSISVNQVDLALNTSPSANVTLTLDSTVPPAPTIVTPVDGSFTNLVAQTVTGVCEVDATVNLSGAFTGSPISVACGAGTYSQAITLTAGDGAKNISATQTNLANTVSAATNISITLDQTNPLAPTITSPVNASFTNLIAQNIIGACEDGAQVRITGNIVGAPVVGPCAAGNYNIAVNLTAANGSKTINARQVDQAGNQSPLTTIAVTLDTIAPPAPTINAPLDGDLTNIITSNLDVTCEDDAEVSVTGDLVGVPLTATCVASAVSLPITYSAGDGPKNITVRQEDLAGNISAPRAITVTVDTSAPPLLIFTSPAEGSYISDLNIVLEGTCELNTTVNLTGNISGGPTSFFCGSTSFVTGLTLTGGQGAKVITATQTDFANNVSAPASLNLIFDSINPAAPIITAPTAGLITNQVIQTVVGTCEADATVNLTGNILSAPVSTPCVAGNFTENVQLTAANGNKTITARQTDLAGNISSPTSVVINLDTSAPAAPTIASPVNGSFTNVLAQTVSGACEINATVNLSGAGIDGGPFAIACPAGTYSQAVTLTAGDGAKVITATQTDVAGNTSAPANSTITLDQTDPVAPTIANPVDGSFTNSVAQTVSGTCEVNATVNISGAGVVGGPIAIACPAGTYSQAVNLTAGDGVKAISATQTDLANNISPATNISVTLDTALPIAPTITSPSNGDFVSTVAQTIVGACEVNATVNISGAGVVGGPIAVACPAGTYSQAVTLTAGDGVKTISATQTDLANNISPVTNISVTLDTAPPGTPLITSPVDGFLTNLLAQTILGNCETGAEVEISGDFTGSPSEFTCVGGTYSQAVNLAAGDGAKLISAIQTDAAGNTSAPNLITINLDQTAPAIPTITSPTDGTLTNQASQTIIGTCENGASISITGNISPAPVAASCLAGNYTANVTLTAGDGAKTITAIQTDPAGNPSLPSNISLNFDGSAPSAPVITSPTDGSFTNLTAQTLVGTCEVDATVNITGAGIVGAPVTVACPAGTYSQAVTLTAGDGAKVISVTQTDLATNVSPATVITLNLDQTVPSVTISTLVISPTPNSPITYNVTFSENILGFIAGDLTVVNGSVTNFVGGPSSYSVEVTPTAAGTVSVSAAAGVAQDTAGNLNTVSNIIDIEYAPNPFGTFRSTWNIPAPGTAVTLPLKSGYNYNFTVNWGDGSPIETVTSDADSDKNHTYAAAGNYVVEINGWVEAWGALGQTCYMTNVLEMGYTGWLNLESAFENCDQLTTLAVNDGTEFSNVTSMRRMFAFADVAIPDGSNWDVSSVTDMSQMFWIALAANPNVASWNVSNVTSMFMMFSSTQNANPNVTNWNVANVLNMSSMFASAQVANPDVATWNVGNVTDMSEMFVAAPLANPNVTNWNVANVTRMNGMFQNADSANPNFTNWNVSSVTDMSYMFAFADSVTAITTGNWNVSNVTNMRSMFESAPNANPSVASWDVSNVTNMDRMFFGTTSANPNVSSWNVENVESMWAMFHSSAANPNVTTWNVGNVQTMEHMFYNAVNANPNVTNWNVTNVGNFRAMFQGASNANPVTTNWVLTSLGSVGFNHMRDFFRDSNISDTNYSDFLVMANTTSTLNGVDLGTVPARYYPYASASRANLVGPRTWIINDLGPILPPAAPTIGSPSDGAFTNSISQTVSGTCENGSTVNILGAGVDAAPVTLACSAGTYSQVINLTAGDGAKTIIVNQTNIEGLTSTNVNITLNLDTGIPTSPVVTLPTNGSFTNQIAQTVSGTCEVDSDVTISGLGITGGPFVISCPAGTYSQAVNLTAGDGAKAISVTQTDLAGNTSAATNITLNLDQTAPLRPVVTSHVDFSYTNTASLTISGTCEGNLPLTFSLLIVGSPVAGNCVGGTFTQAVTLVAGDGNKGIIIRQTDQAGNTSPDVLAITFRLDTTRPSVVIASTESSPTAVSPIPYTITFSENVSNFISGDISVINGSVTAFSGGPSVYSVEVTPTAAGDVTVSVSADVANDVASNLNLASNTLVIDYQSGPPANAFVSQWNIPSNNTNVVLPLQSGYTYNFTIDWGDGTAVTTVTAHNDPDINHNYATAGLYTVTMTGAMQAYGVISPPHTCYITYVDQIGYMGWVDLQWMFKDCEQLTDVVANGDEFATVTRMDGMFYGTTNSTPTVGHWDVSNVGNLGYMFANTNLANPDVRNWNVSNVGGFYHMFDNAAVANPDTSLWNTSSAYGMNSMFKNAVNANPVVNGPNWDTSNVSNMESMFEGALIATPQTGGWNTGNVTNMANMFYRAFAANPNTTNWDVSQVTNMANMFRETVVANPNVSQWRTGNVTNMSSMFYDALSAAPVTSANILTGVWDVSKVVEFHGMFKGTPLANPDTSNWVTTSGVAYYYMFNGAAIANPDVSGWDMTNAGIIQGMFSGAPNAAPNVTNWNTPNMYDSAWAFENSAANPDTSGWDFSNNNFMEDMFIGSNISDLNYSKFLNRASATTTFNNINLGTVPAQYITDAGNPDRADLSRANLVTTRSWSIIDDGPLP